MRRSGLIRGSNTGVGFAIPVSIVQRVVPALIKDGQYFHAYLGIQGGNYSRAWSAALGLPADARGAYVESVVNDGPAAHAGLRAGNIDTKIMLQLDTSGAPEYLERGGDLITAIDGNPMMNMDDVLIYLERFCSPGQTIQLSVLRADEKPATIKVKLAGARRRAQARGAPASHIPYKRFGLHDESSAELDWLCLAASGHSGPGGARLRVHRCGCRHDGHPCPSLEHAHALGGDGGGHANAPGARAAADPGRSSPSPRRRKPAHRRAHRDGQHRARS